MLCCPCRQSMMLMYDRSIYSNSSSNGNLDSALREFGIDEQFSVDDDSDDEEAGSAGEDENGVDTIAQHPDTSSSLESEEVNPQVVDTNAQEYALGNSVMNVDKEAGVTNYDSNVTSGDTSKEHLLGPAVHPTSGDVKEEVRHSSSVNEIEPEMFRDASSELATQLLRKQHVQSATMDPPDLDLLDGTHSYDELCCRLVLNFETLGFALLYWCMQCLRFLRLLIKVHEKLQ